MNRKKRILSIALAVATIAAFAPVASAQSRGLSRSALGKSQPRVSIKSTTSRSGARPSFSSSSRSLGSRSSGISRSNARSSGSALGRQSTSRGTSRSQSGSRSGNSNALGNFGDLGGLLNNARGNGNYSRNGFGNGRYPIAEQLFGEYNRRQNYHDPYESIADAHRDAAIANAVVNVVGIITNAAVQNRQYRVAQPVAQTQQYGGPTGHVQRQQVLVREGHHEEYTVQVPEHTVAATGERVLAHTERRQRWVEPVYEEREVWVTNP